MSEASNSLGRQGEILARDYLARAGYTILEHNYRSRGGELDIIAEEGETLVFVEVKTRKDTAFGSPFEAVTTKKQRQMARVALEYLVRQGGQERPARFDVVAVTFAGTTPRIELMRNAFGLEGDRR